ncbi:MAG: hypothetical protein ABEJ85_03555 [Haloarculaceae archaeon]
MASRRQFLVGVGALAGVSLAGCSALQEGGEGQPSGETSQPERRTDSPGPTTRESEGSTSTPTAAETPTETPTEGPSCLAETPYEHYDLTVDNNGQEAHTVHVRIRDGDTTVYSDDFDLGVDDTAVVETVEFPGGGIYDFEASMDDRAPKTQRIEIESAALDEGAMNAYVFDGDDGNDEVYIRSPARTTPLPPNERFSQQVCD